MEDTLTDKQRRYVENISRGMASREAARSAGYSESFARVAAHRIGGKPAVAQAIEEIQKKGREMAVYDLATAMREANEVCNFAKLHKNAMAYCKGTELRAKLSGLLIDRVEVVEIDLTGALARAEARVLNMTPLLPHGALATGAPSSIDWRPHIPGNPVAKPEAGPTDRESVSKVNNGGSENR
jgi:terminase small subunit-like protein